MILLWLILVPVLGGLAAWWAGRRSPQSARWISLAAMGIDLALALVLVARAAQGQTDGGAWLENLQWDWIPQWGVGFHLAADGLSLILVLLTVFLGVLSVATSWTEIQERVGFFHLNLMFVLAGILGVFLAMDLFVFYFFWELMLVPMYFLIAIWGHENRFYASIKFFLFTQLSGLLMLLAILGLYFAYGRATGTYTFDYTVWLASVPALRETLSSASRMLLMLGFFVAFAVKLPAVPVHTWLPDAHTEAPTAGSVILAGLLLKTGAYGLLRFVLPLFPDSVAALAPIAMALAVAGILYGALLAFSQRDLKRMVAYTSVSHMGFVLLGVFAGTPLALQGVVIQIVAHGISTPALFILVGALQERIHTRDLREMGGLWTVAPWMGGSAMFFALASLGLPGLGNFVAEFLVLLGTWRVSIPATVFASLGLIVSTVYSLWFVQAAFQGPNLREWKLPDLGRRELAMMGAMMAVLLWLGLYPTPVLNASRPVMESIASLADGGPAESEPQRLALRPAGGDALPMTPSEAKGESP